MARGEEIYTVKAREEERNKTLMQMRKQIL